MKRVLMASIRMILVMTVLTGIAYPLSTTGISQLLFPYQSNGSFIDDGGRPETPSRSVGSALIGQYFSSPGYFHGRPSATDYDGANSAGTNLGPTSKVLISRVRARVSGVRGENGLPLKARIPSDLVTASASGLDPHISREAALIQVKRISDARGVEEIVVKKLVERYTEKPYLWLMGTEKVNVLKLNIALDRL